jgi:phosphoribosylformimino-5-aminoimidazole carboxamide ribotide isomerase
MFTIYPAIDLRHGQVVRLAQGDLARQTTYSSDPAETARRWLSQGAGWLHVVNLDGAFEQPDDANRRALQAILRAAADFDPAPAVQFGGGLRALDALQQAFDLGVRRAVLGTAAVTDPALLEAALQRFGPQRLAAGLDARDGRLMLRGWTEPSALTALDAARRLAQTGLRTLITTDIARDGVGGGANLAQARLLAAETGLEVIASGGIAALDDVRQVKDAGLAGVIVGRALYEGTVELKDALALEGEA